MSKIGDYVIWQQEKGYIVWDEHKKEYCYSPSVNPDKLFFEYMKEQDKYNKS